MRVPIAAFVSCNRARFSKFGSIISSFAPLVAAARFLAARFELGPGKPFR